MQPTKSPPRLATPAAAAAIGSNTEAARAASTAGVRPSSKAKLAVADLPLDEDRGVHGASSPGGRPSLGFGSATRLGLPASDRDLDPA